MDFLDDSNSTPIQWHSNSIAPDSAGCPKVPENKQFAILKWLSAENNNLNHRVASMAI